MVMLRLVMVEFFGKAKVVLRGQILMDRSFDDHLRVDDDDVSGR
jgi:hypothetical protein